jgi:hypothetical protein
MGTLQFFFETRFDSECPYCLAYRGNASNADILTSREEKRKALENLGERPKSIGRTNDFANKAPNISSSRTIKKEMMGFFI